MQHALGCLGLIAATVGLAFGVRADPPASPPDAVSRTDRDGDPLPDGARARLGPARWHTGWLGPAEVGEVGAHGASSIDGSDLGLKRP